MCINHTYSFTDQNLKLETSQEITCKFVHLLFSQAIIIKSRRQISSN